MDNRFPHERCIYFYVVNPLYFLVCQERFTNQCPGVKLFLSICYSIMFPDLKSPPPTNETETSCLSLYLHLDTEEQY